jgi:tetratricopeptide (TPR) repeat protein
MHKLALLVGRNDVDAITLLCNNALAADANDLFALMTLADTYWRNENPNDALIYALKVLALEPNEFHFVAIAATILAERGDDAQAYEYARRLSKLKPVQTQPVRALERLLLPIKWIPKVARLLTRTRISEERFNMTNEAQRQWAAEYIAWFEAGATPQENAPE